MDKIVLIVHMLAAFGVIGLILMQQGKGAEAGASFGGGASQTVFGSSGSSNFFSRTTAILATVFFATSFGLAVLSKQRSGVNIDEGIPTLIEQSANELPAVNDSDLPSVDSSAAADDSDLPNVDALVEAAQAKVDDAAKKAEQQPEPK